MQRAIIIGATSGIGRALALELSRRGYAVGVAGRRLELLQSLQDELAGPSAAQQIDVTRHEEAVERLHQLIEQLGGMDLLLISSGIGVKNPELNWQPELETLAVNVNGFVVLSTEGFRYFARQGHGHIAGISSIAGIRGSRFNPAYGASKAFETNYLEALRARAVHIKLPISVTDIRPGFVETPLTASNQRMFWVSTPEKAARQIADALQMRKRVVYITHRWALIAWLLRRLPEWVVEKF